MFRPVTKWADIVLKPEAIPEMVRKAFKLAQTERPGAVYLAVPEDVEQLSVPGHAAPLAINVVYDMAPSPSQVKRGAEVMKGAKSPIVLAGYGAARNGASDALVRFSERLVVWRTILLRSNSPCFLPALKSIIPNSRGFTWAFLPNSVQIRTGNFDH